VCLPLYLLALEQCRGERRGGMCSRLPERQVESAPDGRRRRRRPVLPSWRPGYCVATPNRRRSAPADVNLAPGSKPESGRRGEVQSDQPSSGHPARPCPAPKLRRISAERGAAPSGRPATRATLDASADPTIPRSGRKGWTPTWTRPGRRRKGQCGRRCQTSLPQSCCKCCRVCSRRTRGHPGFVNLAA